MNDDRRDRLDSKKRKDSAHRFRPYKQKKNLIHDSFTKAKHEFVLLETRKILESNEYPEKTEQVKEESRRLSKTQTYLIGVVGLGMLLLVWDRFDNSFASPTIFGQDLTALMIMMPIAGLVGKEVITAILEGVAKLNGR